MNHLDMTAMDQAIVSLNPTMQAILALILIFIMFSVSLSLRVDHFKSIAKQPRDILVGTLAQIIGLPAVTLLVIYILAPPASIALGLIIVASCPGGNVSNFFCKISHADVAYSVTLTALSSLIAMVMIPISILFWGGLYEPINDLLKIIELDRTMFLVRTAVMLAVPLCAGMVVAHYRPNLAASIQRWALPTSMALLMVLVVVSVSDNMDMLLTFGLSIMGIVIFHNAVAFGFGAGIGQMFVSNPAKRRTLVFEVGLQNTGLGLVILLSEFKGIGGAALITATWGIWHLISGVALALYYRKRGRLNG